jgi:aspartyl-tRNA synthetase
LLDFLGDLRRTHMCGALRASDAGKKAVLMGWVNKRRDLGSLIFVDLRDRTGVTQVVINAERDAAIHEKTEALRNEYVIAVTGTVKLRDASTVNKNIATGEVELVAEELRILNESKLPPFLPSDTALTNEETRLKYRYIDLRREVMQFNIEMRHKVAKAIRDYLSGQGFFEIETPFMTRSTPEGARDYLVPSRVQPGTFYALPQSPQLFKQILMISGFDKYFQIVRCFRDEDLRADRQPEFTQIDLEMSYPQPERVWEVVEGFLTAAFAAAGQAIKALFPRMDYDEAIRLYGIDKPDLRLPAFTDVRECFAAENLQELAVNASLPVVAIRTPNVGELSRKERDDIKPMFHSKGGAKIFEDFKRIANKFPDAAAAIAKKTGIEASDLIVLVAGSSQVGPTQTEQGTAVSKHRKVTPQELAIYASAGLLRLALAQKYAERHGIFQKTGDAAKDFRFLWVTNFPMFEWNEGEKTWNAAHHPFTSPHEEDMKLLEEGVEALHDPLSPLSAVRARAYDVVLNGTELGSGSIRIHRQDVQSRIFRALGMTEEEARARFGFFLEALEYGTPPHGGIALGLDRIVMILAGAESLREVIPFPKTARAVDLMVDAPTPVSEAQLKELGIAIRKTRE